MLYYNVALWLCFALLLFIIRVHFWFGDTLVKSDP